MFLKRDYCAEESESTGCEYDVRKGQCRFHIDFLDSAGSGNSLYRCHVFEERNKVFRGIAF